MIGPQPAARSRLVCLLDRRFRRGGGGEAKPISRGDAAVIEAALRGRLRDETPADVAVERALARLVLDGVLEVEAGGGFVCGPPAHGALFVPAAPAAPSRLSALSMRAVQYGAALGIGDAAALGWRLYRYGAVPDGPHWDGIVPAGEGVGGWLSLWQDGAARRVLARDYLFSDQSGWFSWWHRADEAAPAAEPAFKLYVSPRPEAVGAAFPRIAEVFAGHEVRSFKAGRDLHGLLRPDKIVAYFTTRARLDEVAAALIHALDGCAAQGVPFTAELSGAGLLSWGMDPPRQGGSRQSWRVWVTERLARALVAAQAGAAGVAPAVHVLDRLGLDGVDPVTWCPEPGIWPDPGDVQVAS